MSSQGILRFDRQQLEKEIGSLTRSQRIAFLLSIAERFIPYYLRFHKEEAWGEPKLLRAALDVVWATLAGQAAKVDLQALGEEILRVCPDTEKFEGPSVGMALAACSAAVYLLRFIQKDSVEHVLESAQAAVDAVDGYAGWILFPDHVGEDTRQMWQQQLEHPLTQAELRRQKDDLFLLSQKGSLDPGALRELKTRWTEKDTAAG